MPGCESFEALAFAVGWVLPGEAGAIPPLVEFLRSEEQVPRCCASVR